jgi:hypothetical protein
MASIVLLLKPQPERMLATSLAASPKNALKGAGDVGRRKADGVEHDGYGRGALAEHALQHTGYDRSGIAQSLEDLGDRLRRITEHRSKGGGDPRSRATRHDSAQPRRPTLIQRSRPNSAVEPEQPAGVSHGGDRPAACQRGGARLLDDGRVWSPREPDGRFSSVCS